MALNNVFLEDLCNFKRKGLIDGFSSVMEIGAQQLSNSFLTQDLPECYRLFGKPPINLGIPIESGVIEGMEHLDNSNPSSRLFWNSIGFRYASVEFDGHRDSIPLDLNHASVPRKMRNSFDLVVNAGTTEHVANQDNAFRVMHDFCRPGGIMYHQLPAGGMMTHGLITYTPKFFWMLCRENGYEPLLLRMTNHPANPVPQNIRDSNVEFGGSDSITDNLLVPDFTILAALRKIQNVRFATPLDLPEEIKPKKRPGLTARLFPYLRSATSP